MWKKAGFKEEIWPANKNVTETTKSNLSRIVK
jgi:hypothetical protein